MKHLYIIMACLTINACTFKKSALLEPLLGPLEAGWKGQKVCEQLSENKDHKVLRCTFPPGVGHEKHKHNKNFGYALSGGHMKITDKKGTRKVTLKTNSYFQSNDTPWHQVENIGKTTVIYLIIESK